MKPALTAEEWAKLGPGPERSSVVNPHALAAMYLRGQPFGFTREDVKYLREVATAIDRAVTFGDLLIELKALASARGWALADRLEALLPPES